MLKGLKQYGEEDKIIVINETYIKWEKYRQSLQILCHFEVTDNELCPRYGFFLNLLHVNIVLNLSAEIQTP